MKLGAVPASLVCLLLAAALAGCGGSSAQGASNPKPNKAGPTPVPATLSGYASLAVPSLGSALQELDATLRQMQHVKSGTYEDVANTCLVTGGDVSNYFTSFDSQYTPPQATSVYHNAYLGFRSSLAAMDECGIAGDTGKRKSMDQAMSDLKHGLWLLKKAKTVVDPWYRT